MILEDKYPALWHACNALDKQHDGAVNKSKLKVLTHNIANCMGIVKVEDTLRDCYQSDAITFHEYISFLKTNLFSKFTDADGANSGACMDKIDEVCWLLCSPSYVVSIEEKGVVRENRIHPDDAFRLWRVFNFFAEVDADTKMPLQPVVVHCDEVGIFLQKFCSILVQRVDEDEFKRMCLDIPLFSFAQFLRLLETDYCDKADKKTITATIKELYEEHISEVIMKGYLAKKGRKMMTWKDRWFVLKPGILQYYTSVEGKDIKGMMAITSTCRAEPLPEKAGSKPYRFVLATGGHVMEISAPTFTIRSDWLGALRAAEEHFRNNTTPSKDRRDKRRRDREEHKRKEEERQEEIQRILGIEKQVIETKKAQEEAEERAKKKKVPTATLR